MDRVTSCKCLCGDNNRRRPLGTSSRRLHSAFLLDAILINIIELLTAPFHIIYFELQEHRRRRSICWSLSQPFSLYLFGFGYDFCFFCYDYISDTGAQDHGTSQWDDFYDVLYAKNILDIYAKNIDYLLQTIL